MEEKQTLIEGADAAAAGYPDREHGQQNNPPFGHATVWLLTDGRMGHENQSRGVLRALGINRFDVHKLTFRPSSRFFRFLGPEWAFESLPKPPWPDVIIGAGSHVAAVSSRIKRDSPNTFAIHLMNTPKHPGLFNVIAVPQHDNPPQNDPNLISTTGAPNMLVPQRLKGEADRWRSRLHGLDMPYTAVLVGGKCKHMTFDIIKAKELSSALVTFAQRHKTALLVSTSRRTPSDVADIIEKELIRHNIQHMLWRADDSRNQDNPYHAFLGLSDRVIVTADSVSMLSEAASTNARTFIWGRGYVRKHKFQRLYDSLLEQNLIQDMADTSVRKRSPPLNEAGLIADFIKCRYTHWWEAPLLGAMPSDFLS